MNIGDNTPWGAADHVDTIAEGITHVTTPSHGGIHLSPDRNALVPEYMKRDGAFASQRRAGWYEEDCDWCIPAIIFEHEFRAHAGFSGRDWIAAARETFKHWHARAYVIFTTGAEPS
jgi:hypothetical protein